MASHADLARWQHLGLTPEQIAAIEAFKRRPRIRRTRLRNDARLARHLERALLRALAR